MRDETNLSLEKPDLETESFNANWIWLLNFLDMTLMLVWIACWTPNRFMDDVKLIHVEKKIKKLFNSKYNSTKSYLEATIPNTMSDSAVLRFWSIFMLNVWHVSICKKLLFKNKIFIWDSSAFYLHEILMRYATHKFKIQIP